jgi:hypothetical protein
MAGDTETVPLEEWLKFSDAELVERQRLAEQQSHPQPVASAEAEPIAVATQPAKLSETPQKPRRTPNLDEVHSLAMSLTHLHQLKLAARLWSSMPPMFQASLLRLQLEDIQNPPSLLPAGEAEMSRRTLRQFLFDRTNTSELYSAPRRFDLATIFVVTAAYSLLLGGLTALGSWPAVKIMAVGLLTLVAAGQALFHNHANPRGVSVLIGAAAYTLFTLVLWSIYPRVFPDSFFFVVVINGLMFGGLLGYIAGVLVGGMFLVAERLRGKLSPQESDAEAPTLQDSSPGPGGEAGESPHGPRHS